MQTCSQSRFCLPVFWCKGLNHEKKKYNLYFTDADVFSFFGPSLSTPCWAPQYESCYESRKDCRWRGGSPRLSHHSVDLPGSDHHSAGEAAILQPTAKEITLAPPESTWSTSSIGINWWQHLQYKHLNIFCCTTSPVSHDDIHVICTCYEYSYKMTRWEREGI